MSGDSIQMMRNDPQKKKTRGRRIEMDLNEMQDQLQRKAEELQRAEAESVRLRQRLKLLETVLPLRDQIIQMLQSEAAQPSIGARAAPPAARQRPAITELAPSDSDASSVDMGRSPGGGGSGEGGSGGAGSSVAVGVTAEGRAHQGAGPLDWATAGTSGPGASAHQTSLACLHPQPRESADALLQRFIDVWNQDVREGALLLAGHDARPHDPTPALKLMQLKDRNLPLLRAMWREQPSLLIDVARRNLDTGRLEDPPPQHWAAVVRGLHMTAEQKAACLGALDLYRERVGPALQERKSLAHQMSAALALAEGQRNAATAAAAVAETGQPTHQVPGRLAGWSPGGVASAGDSANGCSSGSRSIDMTLEFMSAAESLQRNVGAEGTVLGVIRDFLTNGVFDEVQMKRVAVLSHPFFPDALSVLTAVEELARQGGSGGQKQA
ncbi:hypothetical protein CHLRE_06g285750v5 [Chlamydomonas reinhardtii]|uniref:Uncharacterized protein n=1 Tax=Chlamydomonas reinhardtii TaxID=3055 RepID=A0A2K3DPY8_CHLRE|nr:uncharacterized protein CHLRE_06g285750v5 [Chlamydomonas reinhardtii]PNW82603.1 hypothetical protein CHLRE_06g285750v5 [Chlamydomonas reinhardtii]